ncbi:hypothetical protein EIN_222940 [Entamoeba invadens IP1]|uniref:Uncharacterized protein n=1 Tax=Entamoeba invadens IP1 TaxID=370355 RepID=A0A0A1U230_ENTIV|nr:hypothetical protein EIN_222940 [Entamoeba invadens IP1]ELP88121.1 hypothetical protein EIN_222940 [Entamoeba invadens IP1]|eukprot:XP_004254892.1 hypothetical protein EIN_222940 [Entamoeba invadens IP1]
MGIDHVRNEALALGIISSVLLVLLIIYFIHTNLILFVKIWQKRSNAIAKTQILSPRNICHVCVLLYILCQIVFMAWVFYYFSILNQEDPKLNDFTYVAWYEFINLFDTSIFSFMMLLTIYALRTQFDTLITVAECGWVVKAFDSCWVTGIALLSIHTLFFFLSTLFIMTIPFSVFGDFFVVVFQMQTISSNCSLMLVFSFVVASFILILLFMRKVFAVYEAKESHEIRIRTYSCGITIIVLTFVRLTLCLYHIIYYSKDFTGQNLGLFNTNTTFFIDGLDFGVVIFLKYVPTFLMILMLNKPRLW